MPALAIYQVDAFTDRVFGGVDCLGIIATAPGRDVDFGSRFFEPRAGINEDPVTGSATAC